MGEHCSRSAETCRQDQLAIVKILQEDRVVLDDRCARAEAALEQRAQDALALEQRVDSLVAELSRVEDENATLRVLQAELDQARCEKQDLQAQLTAASDKGQCV